MKRSIFIFIFALSVFSSCHKDDAFSNNDSILGMWYQSVGDATYWFSFSYYPASGSSYISGYVSGYTVTPRGGDPYQYLWYDVGHYSVDDDKQIIIYDSSIEKKIWLSGYISNSTIFLSNESESYQLTKYGK